MLVLVCFSAEREPVLVAVLALFAGLITATFLARSRPLAFSSVGRHPRWWPASPPAVARRVSLSGAQFVTGWIDVRCTCRD